MKIVMIGIAVLIGTLVLALLATYLVGRSLPAEHVAEGTRHVLADVGAVAERIRKVEEHPRWRAAVEAVAVDARDSRVVRYRERSGGDEIGFSLHEVHRDREFASVITDPTLPFGGRWLIRLGPAEAGTHVSIREEGVIHPPLWRTIGKYVVGHSSSLEEYLDSLQRSFEGGG